MARPRPKPRPPHRRCAAGRADHRLQSRIGLEVARQYAERGWRVIATARNPDDAEDLASIAAAHPLVRIEALDVADHTAIDALARRLAGEPIDLLVHNAGISGGVANQQFGRMNYEAFREH